MAFSSDSTCTTDLHSATSGFETLNLTAVITPEWPPQVVNRPCRYDITDYNVFLFSQKLVYFSEWSDSSVSRA